MHLILVRHGDKLSGNDPSLSSHGEMQAQALARRLLSPDWPAPTRLFVSPKKRTRETLTPLAQTLGLTIENEPRLHQRAYDESGADFRRRLQDLLNDLPENDPTSCIVMCTHVDTLEELRSLLPGDALSIPRFDFWSTAQFAVLEGKDGLYTLKGGGE